MDSASSKLEPRSVALVVSLLFAVHLLLGGLSAERDSLTIDEHAHLAAGLSYVQLGDPRLNPEHPPLAKVLCALPLAQARWELDDRRWIRAGEWLPLTRSGGEPAQISASVVSEWAVAHHLLYVTNRDRLAGWIRWGRLMTLLLSGLLGLVVFRFAAGAWGERAGLAAMAVWTFSPTALAHGRLITTDTCTAFFMTCALWAAVRWLQRGDESGWRPAIGLALSLAGALLTKHSTLFLIGFLPLALLSWAASLDPAARGPWLRRRLPELAGAYALAAGLVVAGELLVFGQSVWVTGLELVVRQMTHRESFRAYLLGATDAARYPHYFLVAFALKSTLGLLGLTLAGLCLVVRRGAWRAPLPRTLLLYGALYAAVVVWRFPNVGIRYLLPLYPVLAVGAGGLIAHASGRGRRAAVALLIAHAVAGTLAWPGYLPYMNLISATRGKAFFLDDSNLDWGQGLRALGVWCRARGIERIAYLPANLIADPSFYGAPGVTIRGGDLERLAPGTVVAISVVHLQRRPALRALVAQSEQLGVVAETLVVVRISP